MLMLIPEKQAKKEKEREISHIEAQLLKLMLCIRPMRLRALVYYTSHSFIWRQAGKHMESCCTITLRATAVPKVCLSPPPKGGDANRRLFVVVVVVISVPSPSAASVGT